MRRLVVVAACLAVAAPIAASGTSKSPWDAWLGSDTSGPQVSGSPFARAGGLSEPSTNGRRRGPTRAAERDRRSTSTTSRTKPGGPGPAAGTGAASSVGSAASPTTVTSASQCTSYVTPAGADTNPGTPAAPFATISHAQAAAQPGNVVCVRSGVYRERVRLTRSGRAGAPIIVGAYPGEVPVIDGTGVAVNRTDALVEIAGGTNYVTLQSLVIRNSSGRGVMNGGSHNRVLGSTISNTENAGLLTTNLTAPASNNEYSGNDISFTVLSNNCHTPSDPCSAAGGWESAINHYTAGAHAFGHDVYRGNNIHDNFGEGMTVADRDTVVRNTLHDNFSVNIYLDGTRDALIEKNFVYESERSVPGGGVSAHRLLAMGITLADEIGPRNARNTVRNNLVVNTSIGIHFWEATSGSGLVGDVFDNNTVVDTWNCGICFDAGDHESTQLRNNLVVPRQGTITAGVADVGIASAGNLFDRLDDVEAAVAPSAGTFRLSAEAYRPAAGASSIVDKGVASSAPDDITGTRRPQGAGIDIGAYEVRS